MSLKGQQDGEGQIESGAQGLREEPRWRPASVKAFPVRTQNHVARLLTVQETVEIQTAQCPEGRPILFMAYLFLAGHAVLRGPSVVDSCPGFALLD